MGNVRLSGAAARTGNFSKKIRKNNCKNEQRELTKYGKQWNVRNYINEQRYIQGNQGYDNYWKIYVFYKRKTVIYNSKQKRYMHIHEEGMSGAAART